MARIKSMVSADPGTDGPLGLLFPRLERTRAAGPGWVNSWPFGPESCDHQSATAPPSASPVESANPPTRRETASRASRHAPRPPPLRPPRLRKASARFAVRSASIALPAWPWSACDTDCWKPSRAFDFARPRVRHLNGATFRQNVGLFSIRPALGRGASTSHVGPHEV